MVVEPPLQTVAVLLSVLLAITAVTVICTVAEVLVHPPDIIVLLNQVVCVKAAGE